MIEIVIGLGIFVLLGMYIRGTSMSTQDNMQEFHYSTEIPKLDENGFAFPEKINPYKMTTKEIKDLSNHCLEIGFDGIAKDLADYREYRIRNRLEERFLTKLMRKNFIEKSKASGVDLSGVTQKNLDELLFKVEGKPRPIQFRL